MRIKSIMLTFSAAMLLCSCASTRKIAYFQPTPGASAAETVAETRPLTLQPEDKVSIVVNSKTTELAQLFNLPVVSRYIGANASGTSLPQGTVSGYTVDSRGEIDFPVLGKVRVGGLSREETAAMIKGELIARNLVLDPTVTVEFLNLTVSVLGEVGRPGRYPIDRDRITLLDAIGMAGDLTIWGRRDNVTGVRTEDGRENAYKVDISSAAELFASPVYHLRQNDVVYVEPNSMRARQSTVNGNNVRSSSFWMSLASLLTTITVLIVK